MPASTPTPPNQPVAAALTDVPDVLARDGLVLTEEFVDAGEAADLLAYLDGQRWDATIKRRTQHYGHRFDYLSKSVAQEDASQPIPDCIASVIERIRAVRPPLAPWCADPSVTHRHLQVTINEYKPGVGIASHVDTHSCFADGIVSLSLGAGIAFRMQRSAEDAPVDVSIWLPARSLLVMRSAVRYAWRHGISSRKFDRLETAAEATDSAVAGGSGDGWVPRSRRVSITVRCILVSGACSCSWPTLCDSQGGQPVEKPTRIKHDTPAAAAAAAVAASSSGDAVASSGAGAANGAARVASANRGGRGHCCNPWPPPLLALFAVGFRVCNALLVLTYHDPDEHWQGPEVAHRLAFGKGILTWEWLEGVRGYTHVLPFAALYALLGTLRLDSPWLIAHSPRLLQGLILGLSDIGLWRFAEGHFGRGAGSSALACSMTSWFVWYCGVRTYSSCMEAACLAMALACLPPPSAMNDQLAQPSSVRWQLTKAAAAGALALAIRPTALLVVCPLAVSTALALAPHRRSAQTVASVAAAACATYAVCGLMVDRACYGVWISTAAEFARFNVLRGGASYYGVHPWYWYLAGALPAALASHAPLVALGLLSSSSAWRRVPAATALIASCALSLSPHKELRFLYPLVHPLLLMYGGVALRSMPPPRRHKWIGALLLTNLPIAAYLSLAHQRAPMAAMQALRDEAGLTAQQQQQHPPPTFHVDVLTRCHQTPGLAHLHLAAAADDDSHHPIQMSILHCPPPALLRFADDDAKTTTRRQRLSPARDEHDALQNGLPWIATRRALVRAGYREAATGACHNECDCFFEEPTRALRTRYRRHHRRRRHWHMRWPWSGGAPPATPATPRPTPSHILLFDELYDEVGALLARRGYRVIHTFFHEPRGQWGWLWWSSSSSSSSSSSLSRQHQSRRLLLLRHERFHTTLRDALTADE